jgi:hypothetical protein
MELILKRKKDEGDGLLAARTARACLNRLVLGVPACYGVQPLHAMTQSTGCLPHAWKDHMLLLFSLWSRSRPYTFYFSFHIFTSEYAVHYNGRKKSLYSPILINIAQNAGEKLRTWFRTIFSKRWVPKFGENWPEFLVRTRIFMAGIIYHPCNNHIKTMP